MDTNADVKNVLRKKEKNSRPNSNRLDLSKRLRNKIQQFIKRSKAKRVLVFFETEREAKISPLISYFLTNRYFLFVPIFINGEWLIAQVNKNTVWHYNEFKISQPITPSAVFENLDQANFKKNDIILTPGILFSRKGQRIGSGKGFYDILLERNNSIKVGICFNFQLKDSLPQEPHDVQMDFIITDEEAISTSGNFSDF